MTIQNDFNPSASKASQQRSDTEGLETVVDIGIGNCAACDEPLELGEVIMRRRGALLHQEWCSEDPGTLQRDAVESVAKETQDEAANGAASMKTERTEVDPPAGNPCAACPWRTANHRRPHPEGYYTDANRRRLWNGLRTGEAPGMTCHPTDPANQPTKDTQRTRECAGALILQQREIQAFEAIAGGLAAYRKGRKLAMTREGLLQTATAVLPPPFGRGLAGTTLNMGADVTLGMGTGR